MKTQRMAAVAAQLSLMAMFIAVTATGLSGCGDKAEQDALRLKTRLWSQVPGWKTDALVEAVPAMQKSCNLYLKRGEKQPVHKDNPAFGVYGDWAPFCNALETTEVNEANVRALFEKHLVPYQVRTPGLFGRKQGVFTGYYEPKMEGSFVKTDEYQTPLYRKPDDLLVADLEMFSPDYKGKRLVARLSGNRLLPYHSRSEIMTGALPEKDAIIWLKDPVDAFFLHIQGSGRVTLPNGDNIFVGYAGANGHKYVAIGRYMADQGYLELENVSMQSIREWLSNNPDVMNEVFEQNPSYVFFTIKPDGPYGSQGVILTPERSLAVDRSKLPLGVPAFVNTTRTSNEAPFQKLMVAQDTGGAIKGTIRGDIFYGHTEEAAHDAGLQNSLGTLFVLLPKDISDTTENN